MKRIVRSRGFALVVALWALVGASTLVVAAAETARDSLSTARNRDNLSRAYWAAFGCLERARHAAYRALWPSDVSPDVTMRSWTSLDQLVGPPLRSSACDVEIIPAGLTANINSITGPQLHRLLVSAGVAPAEADSLSDALLDWRDADGAPRLLGAEREWYLSRGLTPPRNGRIAAVVELRAVRGFGEFPAIENLLGVDPDRVLWTRASRAVLASLPGMTDEALAIFYSRGRTEVEELTQLGAFPEMPAAARDTLARYAPALAQATAAIPDAWIMRASAFSGTPPIVASVEIKVALADHRLIELRRVLQP